MKDSASTFETLEETVVQIENHPVPSYVKTQLLVRVYSLLTLQLVATAGLCLLARRSIVFQDPQVMIVGLFCAWPSLLVLTCVRPVFPCNLICLLLFTMGMGTVMAHATLGVSLWLLLEALGMTAMIFCSLTGFVVWFRQDFAWLEAWLFVGLLTLIGFSLLQWFVWSPWLHVLLSWLGTVVFSGFVLYDTSLLVHRFGPDEAIDACLILYLDAMNLFLSLLGTLQSGTSS